MDFIKQHPKLVSVVAIALICMSALANVLYFIFIPIEAQGDPPGFVQTPMPNQQIVTRVPEVVTTSPASMMVLVILLSIVLLIIVIIFAALKYFDLKRKQRDKQRKEDLKRLAQAFEAYKQIHGQYPLSSTFRPEYYTGVNLSNDWNYYGLPGKEHMVHFVPDWPISDPAINYMSRNQVNQYLYYPKENGQKFYLYAHLESPGKNEEIDYNYQDNLLRSWGHYNYRVESGQEQPIEVADDHSTPPPPPIPPQQPQPAVQTQPSSPPATPTPPVAPQPVAGVASEPVEATTHATPVENPTISPATDNTISVSSPAPAPLAAPQPVETVPEATVEPVIEPVSAASTIPETTAQPAQPTDEATFSQQIPQAQDQTPTVDSTPPTEESPTVTLPLAGPSPAAPQSQDPNNPDALEEPRLITPDIR